MVWFHRPIDNASGWNRQTAGQVIEWVIESTMGCVGASAGESSRAGTQARGTAAQARAAGAAAAGVRAGCH